MTIWTALVLGLLGGWLIEWVIDWWFWRRKPAKPAPAMASVASTDEPDRLEDIYGIGPVIADRLRDAGITTFEQLAAMKPKEIREIADLEIEDDADFRSFVSQARDFAKRRREEQ